MAGTDRTLISIVVPVFNEEENVGPLYDALVRVFETLADRYEFEVIFTDNHSTDSTFELLRAMAAGDPRVRAIRFSRNFGYQRSILTGYRNARGEAAIQVDCDLQDPPDLIPEFLRKWEEGYRVVYGIRRARPEGWFLHALRRAFYRLIDFLSEDPLPYDAGDFRLVDRRILDVLAQWDDAQPYLRGSIAAMGFRQLGIPYDRSGRERGRTKFSWYDLTNLAIDGILNHSIVPLRIATYAGLALSVATCAGIAAYTVGKIFFGAAWPAGFATTTALILFSLSVNSMFLGVIGEYLGRIYKQVKRQPVTIVEEKVGGSTSLPEERPRKTEETA